MTQNYLAPLIQRRLQELAVRAQALGLQLETQRITATKAATSLRAAQESLHATEAELQAIREEITQLRPGLPPSTKTEGTLPDGYSYLTLPTPTAHDPVEVDAVVNGTQPFVSTAGKTLNQQVMEFVGRRPGVSFTAGDILAEFPAMNLTLLGQVLNKLISSNVISRNLDGTYVSKVTTRDVEAAFTAPATPPEAPVAATPSTTPTSTPTYPQGYPPGARSKTRKVLDHLRQVDSGNHGALITLDDVIDWLIQEGLGSPSSDSRGMTSQIMSSLVNSGFLNRTGNGVFRVIRVGA
jgi:hypothetical protein